MGHKFSIRGRRVWTRVVSLYNNDINKMLSLLQ